MSHTSRRQLLGLSLAFSTILAAASGTVADAAPGGRTHSAHSGLVPMRMPGLRPGTRLSIDGVSLLVPRPGRGAWGAAIQSGGGQRILGVQTDLDGAVTVFRQGILSGRGAAARAGSLTQDATPLSACSDGAYSLTGASWGSKMYWWYKASSTPGEITQSDAISGLRGSMRNLTQGNNDCGLPDNISATAHYNGTTSKSANIGTDSSCKSSDGTNVADFGNLAAIDLGYACWWTVGKKTVESDMRLNSTEYSWAVNLNGCINKYSVEDVATHEFGHSFGLNDLSEQLHPALTMSVIMLPCQNAETTLGLGDVKGLEALY